MFNFFRQLHLRSLDTYNCVYAARCSLLQNVLLDFNIPGFREQIHNQHVFLKRLDQLSINIKKTSEPHMVSFVIF